MHVPLKLIGSSEIPGGPWKVLKPLKTGKILLVGDKCLGQYPPSKKLSCSSSAVSECLLLQLSQGGEYVTGVLASGDILLWDTRTQVTRIVRGDNFGEDVANLHVCEDSMDMCAVTTTHLHYYTTQGGWRRQELIISTTIQYCTMVYSSRRYCWVVVLLGHSSRGTTIATIIQSGYRQEIEVPVVGDNLVASLDQEGVLLCVGVREVITLISVETGNIVNTLNIGEDICGITWHLNSSMIFLTDICRCVHAFSRTMKRLYISLNNQESLVETLNTDLILKEKSGLEGQTNISVFSYKNDLIVSNSFFFAALCVPNDFENIHIIPEILLIKSMILLTSKKFPNILHKLSLSEYRGERNEGEKEGGWISRFFDNQIRKIKDCINAAVGKSKIIKCEDYKKDMYKLMLPIQQHHFGKDETEISREIEESVFHILKHFALFGHRCKPRIIKKVQKLVRKWSKLVLPSKHLQFIDNLSKVCKLDKNCNLLKYLAPLVRTIVSSYLDTAQLEDINDLLLNLEYASDNIEKLYNITNTKDSMPIRHRILHSSFHQVYTHLSTPTNYPMSRVKKNMLIRLQEVLQRNIPNLGYSTTQSLGEVCEGVMHYLTGQVDLAVYKWAKDTDSHPEHLHTILLALLACYRLSDVLYYTNWVYLHHRMHFSNIAEIVSQVLAQYFTGQDMVIPSVLGQDYQVVLERELVTQARTQQGLEEIISQEFVLRLLLASKGAEAAANFARDMGDEKLAVLIRYIGTVRDGKLRAENNLLKCFLDQIDFTSCPDEADLGDILTISALVMENIIPTMLNMVLARMEDILARLVIEEEGKPETPAQLFLPVCDGEGDRVELYQLCRWFISVVRVAAVDRVDMQIRQCLDRFYLLNYLHILVSTLKVDMFTMFGEDLIRVRRVAEKIVVTSIKILQIGGDYPWANTVRKIAVGSLIELSQEKKCLLARILKPFLTRNNLPKFEKITRDIHDPEVASVKPEFDHEKEEIFLEMREQLETEMIDTDIEVKQPLTQENKDNILQQYPDSIRRFRIRRRGDSLKYIDRCVKDQGESSVPDKKGLFRSKSCNNLAKPGKVTKQDPTLITKLEFYLSIMVQTDEEDINLKNVNEKSAYIIHRWYNKSTSIRLIPVVGPRMKIKLEFEEILKFLRDNTVEEQNDTEIVPFSQNSVINENIDIARDKLDMIEDDNVIQQLFDERKNTCTVNHGESAFDSKEIKEMNIEREEFTLPLHERSHERKYISSHNANETTELSPEHGNEKQLTNSSQDSIITCAVKKSEASSTRRKPEENLQSTDMAVTPIQAFEDFDIPSLCLENIQSEPETAETAGTFSTFENISSLQNDKSSLSIKSLPLLTLRTSRKEERNLIIDKSNLLDLKSKKPTKLETSGGLKLLTFRSRDKLTENENKICKNSYKVRFDDNVVQKEESISTNLTLLHLPKYINEESIQSSQLEDMKEKAKNISKDIHDMKTKARIEKDKRQKARRLEEFDDLQKNFSNIETKLTKHEKLLLNIEEMQTKMPKKHIPVFQSDRTILSKEVIDESNSDGDNSKLKTFNCQKDYIITKYETTTNKSNLEEECLSTNVKTKQSPSVKSQMHKMSRSNRICESEDDVQSKETIIPTEAESSLQKCEKDLFTFERDSNLEDSNFTSSDAKILKDLRTASLIQEEINSEARNSSSVDVNTFSGLTNKIIEEEHVPPTLGDNESSVEYKDNIEKNETTDTNDPNINYCINVFPLYEDEKHQSSLEHTLDSTQFEEATSPTYFDHVLEYAKPSTLKSGMSLQEKLLAVEALNYSFEDDFVTTSKIFKTIDRISETD